MSFGGLFSAIGDPASFVSREDRSFELYDNVMVDRGDHHLKAGAYLFPLEFNPVNPNQARGAFTFNGQWTGNAFADFLLGYPASAQAGLGRADEHGRATWFHVYAQDDWKARANLTLNYGLRYEINGQMTDIDNRLSAIDLTVPGGRFVLASDGNGRLSRAQERCCRRSDPRASQRRLDQRSAAAQLSALRAALGAVWTLGQDADTVVNAGFGVFLNQWA